MPGRIHDHLVYQDIDLSKNKIKNIVALENTENSNDPTSISITANGDIPIRSNSDSGVISLTQGDNGAVLNINGDHDVSIIKANIFSVERTGKNPATKFEIASDGDTSLTNAGSITASGTGDIKLENNNGSSDGGYLEITKTNGDATLKSTRNIDITNANGLGITLTDGALSAVGSGAVSLKSTGDSVSISATTTGKSISLDSPSISLKNGSGNSNITIKGTHNLLILSGDTDSSITSDTITAKKGIKIETIGLEVEAGDITVDTGDLEVTRGNATIGGTLDVTEASTFRSTVDITGNTTVGGTLDVAEDTSVGGDLGVIGNTSVGGTLGVTGASTFSSTVDIDGNTTVGGTLDVTEDTTLSNVSASGTLNADGATTLGSTLGVTGNTTISGTLGVTGATTLSSALGVTGATTLSSALGVTGKATLNDDVDVSGNLKVVGNSDLQGITTLNQKVKVYWDNTSSSLVFEKVQL